jgi:hypothetical protein
MVARADGTFARGSCVDCPSEKLKVGQSLLALGLYNTATLLAKHFFHSETLRFCEEFE